jgi:hypothetical protein
MPNIQIGDQIIKFPNSGADANWAPAIVQFAEAVGTQLLLVGNPGDKTSRVDPLPSNGFPNWNIPNAQFTGTTVRKFIFSYAIMRKNQATPTPFSVAEQGVVEGIYNSATSSWEITHNFTGTRQPNGEAYHLFNMSGAQLRLSAVAIAEPTGGDYGTISWSAKTELVSNL